MTITLDGALGIHQPALTLRARQAEVIANNIANADTPNFKARAIDFRAILSQAEEQQSRLSLATTQQGHQAELIAADFSQDLLYRVPLQPSVDGNTVEVQEEMARYTDNSMRYLASFEFLNSKFSGLRKALRGE